MATTFDNIDYPEPGRMLAPCLDRRRVFVSACEMATAGFAREILPGMGCSPLIGPKHKIGFGDAAAFWVAFYHLMFKANDEAMKRTELRRRITELVRIFAEPVSYFTSATSGERGHGRVV